MAVVRKLSLRWYGHVMWRQIGVGIRRVLEVDVAGVVGRGRPRMGWKEQVERDIQKAGLRCEQVSDRYKWCQGVWKFSS